MLRRGNKIKRNIVHRVGLLYEYNLWYYHNFCGGTEEKQGKKAPRIVLGQNVTEYLSWCTHYRYFLVKINITIDYK
jgi:hypothetical protein